MVPIFNLYHFKKQLVDTIEDMSSLTITNHNKLLIAKENYTVEVKDLMSDMKCPVFFFPTVDKVLRIIHSASGNYVATLEGKQTFQKSDMLTVRIYTNWETNFIMNDPKKPTKYEKRHIRARIAGVVTPSSAKTEEDYLDMIEIPILFTSPTLLTCCQKTGKILITCGPTMHLFSLIYSRSYNGKSPIFMDFIPFTEVFQVDFLPIAVIINENVIAAYSTDEISVFKLKRVGSTDPNDDSNVLLSNFKKTNKFSIVDEQNDEKIAMNETLHVNSILKMVLENQEDQLKSLINSCSFPIMVPLQNINDAIVSTKQRKFPFKILNKKINCYYKNSKVQNNFVKTLSDKELTVVAENLLALRINDPEEIITGIALQILTDHDAKIENNDFENEIFCVNSSKFIALNFLFTTYQEGYLFYVSSDTFKEGLECVAVFSFTSQVVNVMFENCFLHVLTQTGIETYNIPTLRSVIFKEKPNLVQYSQFISVIGMHPFIGIVDFISSKDFITIFTSANDKKTQKESLPWTVYSLKIPNIFEVYQEMIENSNGFKSQDDEMYKYLSLESFLMLQIALNLRLSIQHNEDELLVSNTHLINSIELAKIYLRSGNMNDIEIGSAIILASEIDIMKFIKSFKNEKLNTDGIMYLLKKWIEQNKNLLNEETIKLFILIFGENNKIKDLTLFLLLDETICRTSGHRALQYLKKYFNLYKEKSDLHVVFALCVVYTLECHQDDASEILKFVVESEEYRKAFAQLVLKHWTFLFDVIVGNDTKRYSFSELSSILIDHLPLEMAEILSKLILKEDTFSMSDIVQMLLKQFPCHVSLQKGHYVLQKFLELIFSAKSVKNLNDPNMNNCLKILVRSYLTQLTNSEITKSEHNKNDYQPIFIEKLPDFVPYLPVVENINYTILKRLQELVWSKMLDKESVNEIIETLPNANLKLNLMAMLNYFDFIKELIKNNYIDAIAPYAKSSFNNVKKWKDFFILLQNKISDLKDSEENTSKFEEILRNVLEYLAHNMSPSQLNTVLNSTIPKTDEIYWKAIVKAQQISYANEVKELICNTGQQLLYSNSVY